MLPTRNLNPFRMYLYIIITILEYLYSALPQIERGPSIRIQLVVLCAVMSNLCVSQVCQENVF